MTTPELDLPPRPGRSRLQELAFERAQHIRQGHGDSPRVREIEAHLARADLLAAVDRYRAKVRSVDQKFARQISSRLVTGV